MLNFKNFLKENPEVTQEEDNLNNSFCLNNDLQIINCI